MIALFYGHGVHIGWLTAALGLTLLLGAMNRAYVLNGLVYGGTGAALWYTLHEGGVHATIAGVILGLMIPARAQRPSRQVLRELAEHVSALEQTAPDEELDGAEISAIEDRLEDLRAPIHRFVHILHPWVAFLIVPVFALANAGVSLQGVGASVLTAPVALGCALGLLLGKPIGIFGLTMVAVKLGLAPIPGGGTAAQLFGVSVIAGIGFTVALFIASLAYPGAPELLDQAKAGILAGSIGAGVLGFVLLRATSPHRAPAE